MVTEGENKRASCKRTGIDFVSEGIRNKITRKDGKHQFWTWVETGSLKRIWTVSWYFQR